MTFWKQKHVLGKRVSISTFQFSLLESLSVVNSANNDPAKIRRVFPPVVGGNTRRWKKNDSRTVGISTISPFSSFANKYTTSWTQYLRTPRPPPHHPQSLWHTFVGLQSFVLGISQLLAWARQETTLALDPDKGQLAGLSMCRQRPIHVKRRT